MFSKYEKKIRRKKKFEWQLYRHLLMAIHTELKIVFCTLFNRLIFMMITDDFIFGMTHEYFGFLFPITIIHSGSMNRNSMQLSIVQKPEKKPATNEKNHIINI